MNIFLWILQFILAVHTTIGAVWKFSHSAQQTMPSLAMIPQHVWIGMAVFEILCSLALIAPAMNKTAAKLVPNAAICIGAEMLVFCGLHLLSGDPSFGPMIYWLVVTAVCGFVAYIRK